MEKKLWYNKPASNWNEALPVGNGRLGGMVFSEPFNEKIQLNEDSVWSGGRRNRNNKNALPNLEKVRKLLLDEKIEEAEKIVFDAFCGVTPQQRHYMPLCDFCLSMDGSEYSDYERELNIENAVCTTVFTADGIKYTREVIASNPANTIIINIRADKPGAVSVKVRLDGRDDYFDDWTPVNDKTFLMFGGMGGEDAIYFASAVSMSSKGGNVSTYGNFLKAENCDEVSISISCETSFREKDYKNKAIYNAEKALSTDYDIQRQLHINDYQSFFNRVDFILNDNSDGGNLLSTDERIKRLGENDKRDNELMALYHAFGRYLMISGSRENTLPLNLQGIWNKDMWPAWGGKYTININTEMNYWPVESCNLSELHTPLFDLIERMRSNGRETAKVMYNCGGFCAHHNTDIWGDTAPQDLWMPATQWVMGAAWLCLHIYEHYKFTLDKNFLAEKYDTMKEASEFFTDFLIYDKKGRLVTCPSISPENTYITKSGSKGNLCVGPSMDSQIIYQLFTAVIESSAILGKDKEYADMLAEMREKLPKPEIGKYGQIKEWAEDYDEVEPGHRHISQLFALYPADIISVRNTPELADAARATIERRLSYGGGHTGWSRAWIINMWACLLDGEKVYQNIIALISRSTNPNMLDSHPPFQIDGNFGGTAGITEAVLQSGNGVVSIIPALPSEWRDGSFTGLKSRGGFTVSAKWSDGKLMNCEITSDCGELLRLETPCSSEIYCDGVKIATTDGYIEIKTEVGKTYNTRSL